MFFHAMTVYCVVFILSLLFLYLIICCVGSDLHATMKILTWRRSKQTHSFQGGHIPELLSTLIIHLQSSDYNPVQACCGCTDSGDL